MARRRANQYRVIPGVHPDCRDSQPVHHRPPTTPFWGCFIAVDCAPFNGGETRRLNRCIRVPRASRLASFFTLCLSRNVSTGGKIKKVRENIRT